MRAPALARLVLVTFTACSGGGRDRDPSPGGEADAATHQADAAVSDPDAGREVDGGGEPGTVVVFDNSARVFKWKARCHCLESEVGRYLDPTKPAEEQDGLPVGPSIELFERDPEIGNITTGGFWFRGSMNSADGPLSAFFAAGSQVLIDGPVLDVVVTPPQPKLVGDTVGPDDTWVDGEPQDTINDPAGVQTAHLRDASSETGPDQIWFRDGIVGIRFRYQGGIHYGFVELDWRQPDTIFLGWYRPVRWGYQPEPDAPLVIPP